ncbi:MAG: bifunctional UDP-3-O-[3-hydroxymyristoyl] N-acetylglucosamine deacetylase/3-hydroxyacyl-ACP dehydratase [Saprospiraceae bacterium]|nr:bifunctional UDP-3-O-[3-hydroxymyristoyl] N-acetylglucosamine deacetylase/3-hydroxyacyl-ACP dehydratase [Saprospiraceae bacterium]MBK7812398.1 bifunctional UDP-3-O-[3-hydroxymyristoyl] N-acetylglucosamine deacetylase/3-hydroxyacyl-ACP dehydratase [Saprospiraceae bacterium]
MNQTTIANETTVSGVGLHTGSHVTLTFKPAPAGHGIRFMRIDLPDRPIIMAEVSKVVSTNRGTTLQEGLAQVWTVEHTLSALSGMGIDNVLIELDGPEIPILDGSAKVFVDLFREAQIKELDLPRDYYVITEPISFEDEVTGAEYTALPHDQFELTSMIDFDSNVLGQQFATLHQLEEYATEIAPCRTFVFLHELEKLLDQNLIKGGDLDNAIVLVDRLMSQEELDTLAHKLNKPSVKVDKEGVLNTLALHFPNEPARHKLLDVLGDLTLLGRPIKGKIITSRSGHKSNVEFAKVLLKKWTEQKKLEGVPVYNPDLPPIYNTVQIQNMLPHRYPFLLVDKVVEMSENHVVGIKNVTINEGLFQGHFPNNPVFPGMLQLEALAQTGGVLALSKQDDPDQYDTYFLKVENARFRQKVLPGDTLILKMVLISPIRRGLVQMRGHAFVGTKLVCEADLTAQIIKRDS